MYHVANTNDPPPMPDSISDSLRSFLHLCFQRNPQQRPSADELLLHPFVSSVAADFASMTVGNQMSVDLSQVLDSRSNRSNSNSEMSSIGGFNNNSTNEGSSMDAIAFDERGAMGTNDVLGTLSLSSDATDAARRMPNGSPAAGEPFDITSFSLVPNGGSPAPESSIREYLTERGKKTELMGSGIRSNASDIGSPDLNPFSSANIDGIVPDATVNGDSLSGSHNNPQEHSLTIEEQEEQRRMQETYLQAQERPLTTDHAVRNSQAVMEREERAKALKAAKDAAWQKELADELDFQRSMRLPVDPPRPKELVLHGDYSS